MKVLRKYFWAFGLSVALSLALLFGVIFALLSWLQNPNGIFHDASGTNWNFVYETAASWFVPTFLYTFVIASIGHLLMSRYRGWQSQRQNGDVGGDAESR